jgi:predicted nucleic acid-binding protein
VKSAGAVAPPLWRLEVANVLEMNVRRGRHGRDFRDTNLLDLTQLRIRIDTDCEKFLWGATLELAERHRLTLYDAIYLELAKRLSLPLATLDRQLRSAATMEQVVLLGE